MKYKADQYKNIASRNECHVVVSVIANDHKHILERYISPFYDICNDIQEHGLEYTDEEGRGKGSQKLTREELEGGDTWVRWIMQTATRFEDIAMILQETGIEIIDHDHRRIAEYVIEMNTLVNEICGDLNTANSCAVMKIFST